MEKYIIFGAGKNGKGLLNFIDTDKVNYFVDNDSSKWGTQYKQIPVISFDEMKKLKDNENIILSVDSDEMRIQLNKNGFKYIFFKDYLCSQDIVELDEKILKRYSNTSFVTYEEKEIDNWYRDEFYSEKNKRIVDLFQNGQEDVAFEGIKSKNEELYFDEYFINRPGMRLAKNVISVIKENVKVPIKVCDLAFGHGELLKELSLNEDILCYGVDFCEERVSYLIETGG